ncbi:hypothetical protein [Bacillus sp. SM2101]|uniref:hypothetical protein n=1 Tax=Bacillus sp. SM2101 TaxID=2805366 RepID=UPI001BDE777E|nr:hypothetical protein [Bacillus sp. SM2101]
MNNNSLYTKIGFSKNFSACGRWQFCNLGENECFYIVNNIDPEVAEGCFCYQRNHKMIDSSNNKKEGNESLEPSLPFNKSGQLSMF